MFAILYSFLGTYGLCGWLGVKFSSITIISAFVLLAIGTDKCAY